MLEHDATKRGQITECFVRLRAVDAVAERVYSFGGRVVRVRYLHEGLISRLHPAIAHRETDAGTYDFTIHAYVGVRPPIDLPFSDWLESSRQWKSRPLTLGMPFSHCIAGDDGRLDLLLGDLGEALTCFRDPYRIPAWDVATPFRDILHVFNRFGDGHVVHGALVGDERNAVLLAGVGGSGKSSTAMACLLHSDLFYLGDDLGLIRRHAQGFDCYSLYNSAKLLPHDVPRFAGQLSAFDDSARGDGKPTFFTFPQLRQRLTAHRALKALVLVSVAGSEGTAFEAAGSGVAWRAVGPPTLTLLPCDQQGIQWLADLARALPAWRLKVGSRREEIPQAIKQILSNYAYEKPG